MYVYTVGSGAGSGEIEKKMLDGSTRSTPSSSLALLPLLNSSKWPTLDP